MGRQRELLRLSIILCMGLLFVMAGIFLIVGKLAGKRPASIAVGVLMIAWGLLCGIPELRSWMLARATDLEHTLEAMWAGLDGDGRMMTSIDGLFAILEDRGLMPAVALFSLSAVLGLLYLSSGNLKRRRTPPPTGRGCQAFHAQWHGPSSDASHVDSSKKDTVGKESKKHES